MKRTDTPSPAADDRVRPALAWLHRAKAEEELLQAVAQRVQRKRARRLAVGGALAVLILASATFPLLRHPAAPEPNLSSTRVVASATATITRPPLESLNDGSTIELKDDAQVAVDFSAQFRRVRLVRGEAHFQVAHDARRPFIVQAGGIEVRAVGTAFSVQLAREGVDVLVTQGTVRVRSESAGATLPAADVTAGRRCVVESASTAPRVEEIPGQEADTRLAWRIPQLEFSHTPLPEVVALMNQHAPDARVPRLEIVDADLNRIKLTGLLRADNTEGLVRLLETSFDVSTRRTGERISLQKKSP
jgi:transmembrane sensor